MKIAIFHELHQGGARRSANEFAKRLQRDHAVDLYIVDEQKNKKEEIFFNKTFFYKFIPRKWNGGNWKNKLYKDTLELYYLYKLHRKIAEDINSKKYDLVLLEPSKFTQAPFILRFIKTKKIYYCQEPLRMVYEEILDIKKDIPYHKFIYEKINRDIRKRIDRNNIRYADQIISNSRYTQSNIKSAYGLESTPSYMGVDIKVFKPVKVKKDIDILFIGAYEFADGYNLLQEAQNHMKNQVTIKVLASEKQWITSDAMIRELYCRSKIVLALAYNEPFGLIPLEAMACEVPVVAVNDGGYRETIIDGKTGYLVSRDPKILAKKLDFLLSHTQIRERMSKNARSHIEKTWTWEKSVENLEKILSMHRFVYKL